MGNYHKRDFKFHPLIDNIIGVEYIFLDSVSKTVEVRQEQFGERLPILI